MSSSVFRRPAVVDASAGNSVAKVTTSAQPIRAERVTEEHVQDAPTLAAIITRVVQAQADSTSEARGDPLRAPTVYKGLIAGGPDKIVIRHGLGRRAFWWVVGWYGNPTSGVYDLVSDEQDATDAQTDINTLALRSTVYGIVDVAVA